MIRALAMPVTVPVAAAVARVARMDEPLKRHIDRAEATGEDVTALVWREYVDYQKKLLPYRWDKFLSELMMVGLGHRPISELTCVDAVFAARWLTKCLVLFLVFVMLGRGSVFPAIEPTSPFVEEVRKNWHVNQIDRLGGETSESVHFLILSEAEFPTETYPLRSHN